MKEKKMMFYTSDKLTNVFECAMFVSQFNTSYYIWFDFKRKLVPDECENHSKAFACLLFFIVNEGLF